jgi:hypothetical protein
MTTPFQLAVVSCGPERAARFNTSRRQPSGDTRPSIAFWSRLRAVSEGVVFSGGVRSFRPWGNGATVPAAPTMQSQSDALRLRDTGAS